MLSCFLEQPMSSLNSYLSRMIGLTKPPCLKAMILSHFHIAHAVHKAWKEQGMRRSSKENALKGQIKLVK